MTELVSLKQERQTATSLYGNTEHLTELFEAVKKVAPWANDQKQPMTPTEIGLVVRKAVAMGLDPLNPHEVQIWKDHRGSVNFQIGYPLTVEWVRYFHGEHTEPQYTRLNDEQLKSEGLGNQDIAYRVSFLMKKDLPGLQTLIQAGYTPQEARQMLEVTGLGTSSAQEYGSQFFAPNARSKSWKVQKRALMDAYRRKFGAPNRAQIEELRRSGGFDSLRPSDWEDGAGLADGDAVALAKSRAEWREHKEAMEADPEYRAAQNERTQEAASAIFGITIEAEGDWMDEARQEADAEDTAVSPFDDAKLSADIARAVAVVEAERENPAAIDDTPFTTPESAIQWGVTAGAFTHGTHSKNAYNKLKAEAQPQTSREMARLWREDVARRLTEKVAQAEAPRA